jgi:hypothetical protein
MPWASSRDVRLGSLLRIAESSLAVTHLAELDLKKAPPNWTARRTLRWMQRHGFDAAPIDEPEVRRLVAADTLRPDDQPVVEQAQPMDAALLVSSDLSLADGVSRLAAQPFYFVLQQDRICGIVTRADLQRPAVSVVAFGLVLAAESAMNVLIGRRLGQSWMDDLSESQRRRIAKIFEDRRRTNTEVTPLECLMLNHRLTLLRRCPEVVSALGYSSAPEFDAWEERLLHLRNTLAHGGGLLHAEPDPLHAVELFEGIRHFAEGLWRLAQGGRSH